MTKPATLVWVSGKRTKITNRATTIHALDKNDRLVVANIPTVHIADEEKVVGCEEYRYLVPQWWAHQNKLRWEPALPRGTYAIPRKDFNFVFINDMGSPLVDTRRFAVIEQGDASPRQREFFFATTQPASEYEQFQQRLASRVTQKEPEMEQVNLSNYSLYAMRTAKMMNTQDMLLHGALGICTEVGEMAEGMTTEVPERLQYMVKELGDLFWFINYTSKANDGVGLEGLTTQDPSAPVTPQFLTLRMAALAADVGSMIKAAVFYGKPLNSDDLQAALAKLTHVAQAFAIGLEVPLADVLRTNIEKLKKRYPDAYSDLDAVERKDENPQPSASGEATPAYVAQ